jgi:hypothetical protein
MPTSATARPIGGRPRQGKARHSASRRPTGSALEALEEVRVVRQLDEHHEQELVPAELLGGLVAQQRLVADVNLRSVPTRPGAAPHRLAVLCCAHIRLR